MIWGGILIVLMHLCNVLLLVSMGSGRHDSYSLKSEVVE